MIVYIVKHSAGIYDEFRSWIGKVFVSKEMAQKHVEEYNKPLLFENIFPVTEEEYNRAYHDSHSKGLCEYETESLEYISKELNVPMEMVKKMNTFLYYEDNEHPATIQEIEVTE